jgi:DNA recombination protein RmuC
LVDNLWQRSDLECNTRNIAECGSKMYDQLVAFSEALQGVEKGLKTAQGSYDEAYKRFTQGNNNLVRLGERMVGLNVKIKKRLAASVRDAAELDADSVPVSEEDIEEVVSPDPLAE